MGFSWSFGLMHSAMLKDFAALEMKLIGEFLLNSMVLIMMILSLVGST